MTDLNEALKQAKLLQKQLETHQHVPELNALIEAVTGFVNSGNWQDDTHKLCGEIIGLTEDIEAYVESYPKELTGCLELAEWLVSEIRWQWVRKGDPSER